MVIEHLLGFDARVTPNPPSADWTAERRNEFLLRTKVSYPLSVDRMVWSSVLEADIPFWVGANSGLWEDLNQLRTHLEVERAGVSYWEVAVAYIGKETAPALSIIGPYLEPTQPVTSAPDWAFLGYDVADGALLSGLSNCGQEQENLAWAQYLNDWHLFEDWSRATEFAAVRDQQVPEHAPFFVYALWRVSSTKRATLT